MPVYFAICKIEKLSYFLIIFIERCLELNPYCMEGYVLFPEFPSHWEWWVPRKNTKYKEISQSTIWNSSVSPFLWVSPRRVLCKYRYEERMFSKTDTIIPPLLLCSFAIWLRYFSLQDIESISQFLESELPCNRIVTEWYSLISEARA